MNSRKRVRGRTLRKIEELFDSSWWVGKTALSLIREQSGFKESVTRAATREKDLMAKTIVTTLVLG